MRSEPSPNLRSRIKASQIQVAFLSGSAAVGGAFAGCHPTGTHAVDQLETAVVAGLFTVMCSRSARGTWLLVGVTVVLMSKGWLLLPATATVLAAFWFVRWPPRRCSVAGALVGALGAQVMLRWPERAFHGFPTLVASVLILVCAASGWWNSSPSYRRWFGFSVIGLIGLGLLLSLPLVLAALLVRGDVLAAQHAADLAFHDVGGGTSASAAGELNVAKDDASHATSVVGGWWTDGARLVPVVAQQGRLMVGALDAARVTSSIGERRISAIDYHNLEYRDGQINLGGLRAMAAPARIIGRQLHVAIGQLSAVSSGWVLGPIEDRVMAFQDELARSAHTANLAQEAVRILPGLLGGDGPRNYLVAFMSPSESRGYDGFIGSYGLLTADDGRVSLSQSGPTVAIEEALPPSGAILTGVPQFLARYGAFDPGDFARDATYSPDLPTDADVFAQVYEQAGGGTVDGVLAIDPYGLAALLRITGPIEVPGLPVPLTYRNAAEVLLKQQYTTFDVGLSSEVLVRRDFLQGALRVAFDRLVSGSLPSPKLLSAILDPEVVDGRISFWSFHRDEQPLLRQLGIDGSFPTARGKDLLAVTTQNSGNNKIDAFLHKSINDHVTFNPRTGSVSSTVTVKLVNDAPSSGLPPYVIADPGSPGTAAGVNVTWLTVYSPLVFNHVTVNSVPSSMTVGRELGVNAFSSFIDIPSKGTVVVRIHLVGHIDPGSRYRLAIRLQPSANSQLDEVEVSPSSGWRLATGTASGRWTLGTGMRQARWFDFVPS